MQKFKWLRVFIFSLVVLYSLFSNANARSLGGSPVGEATFTKTASPIKYSAPGQKITYTYTISNTGATLLDTISVTDSPLDGPVTCQSTLVGFQSTITCTAQYTITEADIAAGAVTNNATMTAKAYQGAGCCGCTPIGGEIPISLTASATVVYEPPASPLPLILPPISTPILTSKVTFCEPVTGTVNFQLMSDTDLGLLDTSLKDGSVFMMMGESKALCSIPGANSTAISCLPEGKVSFPAQVKMYSGDLVVNDFEFSGYECLPQPKPGDEPSPIDPGNIVVPPICPPTVFCK